MLADWPLLDHRHAGDRIARALNSLDLAVGSVFSGIGHNEKLLAMQLDALDRTTSGFDHFVYLNNADEALFTRSTIVGKSDRAQEATPSHLEGLRALSDVFRSRSYKHYLILDSDCFPIRQNWTQILELAMTRAGKRFAAPARVENLHLFPHPCVLYTPDPAWIEFEVAEGVNFLGETFSDISCAGPRDLWFPLLKTNRVSPHPFLAAIYYDLFYHHGCGTRPFGMRSATTIYYEHLLALCAAPEELMEQFLANRDSFVQGLR